MKAKAAGNCDSPHLGLRWRGGGETLENAYEGGAGEDTAHVGEEVVPVAAPARAE